MAAEGSKKPKTSTSSSLTPAKRNSSLKSPRSPRSPRSPNSARESTSSAKSPRSSARSPRPPSPKSLEDFIGSEEDVAQDEGFHIVQLIVNLNTFGIENVKGNTRGRVLKKTGRRVSVGAETISGSCCERVDKLSRDDETDRQPAMKLMNCIRNVIDMISARKKSDKLQTLILDWLQPTPSQKKVKPTDQTAFVKSRNDFWQTFRADTQRWEGEGSMLAFNGDVSSKTSTLRVASEVAKKMCPEEPLWKKDMKATALGSAAGLAARTLRATGQEADMTPRPVTAPALPLQPLGEEKEVREKKLLAEVTGMTTVLPRQKKPAILAQLPGYFEMAAQRRTTHREKACTLTDSRPFTSPGHACTLTGSRPFTSPGNACTLTDSRPSTSPVESDTRKLTSCDLCVERAFDHIWRDPPEDSRRIDIDKHRLCKPAIGGAVAELARQRQGHRLRLSKSKLKPLELSVASSFAERMHPYSRKDLEIKSSPLLKCKSMPVVIKDAHLFPHNVSPSGQPSHKPAKILYQERSPARTVKTDRWRYMRECDRLRIVPRMPPFLLGNSNCDASDDLTELYNLSISGQAMKDDDLVALMEPIQSLKAPQVAMDLSHNMFSDTAVAQFLKSFPSRAVCRINLSCSGAGMTSVEALVENMHTKWPRLRVMQLAGCSISEHSWEPLCLACTTATSPTRLDFVDMRLGRTSQQSVRHVASIVSQAHSLEYMDLSGNFIFYEGFEALADAVKVTKGLRVLNISHNAATQGTMPSWKRPYERVHGVPLPPNVKLGPGGGFVEELPTFHPAALLAEALSENTTLQELHLASSNLDFSVDCCLLLAIQTNRTLQSLDLRDNPHGKDGLRALLRLIVTPGLKLEFCNIQELRPGCLGPGVAQIEFGAPGTGPYNLNLGHPQNRAVVRWLLRIAEISGGLRDPQAAFVDLCWPGARHGDPWCWRNAHGEWDLPKSGMLRFDFILDNQLSTMRGAGIALKKWQRIRRVPVTLSRFVYVLNMFNSLVSSDEKTLFVMAMSDTLLPKTCHIKKLVEACPEIANETIRTLYAHATDADPLLLFDALKWTQGIRKDLRREARACFFWNVRLPTNNYTLELGNPMDRAVAERLFVVNYFDAMTSRERKDQPDTSQHGNWEGVRNFLWEGARQTSLIMYTLPNYGAVSLDYVSPPHYAPKRNDDTTSDEYLSQLKDAFRTSPCAVEDKVLALRSIAHNFTLSPKQIHDMCAVFPNPNVRRSILGISREQQLSLEASSIAMKYDVEGALGSAFFCNMSNPRIEVFVLLFTRCVEPPTLCTYECLYDNALFSREDSKEIVNRLGHIRTMDAIHCCRPLGLSPEACKQRGFTCSFAAATNRGSIGGPVGGFDAGRYYSLQLDIWEDWIVAGFLLILDEKEGGMSIVRSDWTGHASLAARGVDFVIPTDWRHEGRHPHEGTVTFTFISENEDSIRYNVRRSLAEKFFAWEHWEPPS